MQAGRDAVHLRAELVALAKRIRELPLVLVSAPGGSGKSTLLAGWRGALEADGIATAWIDLVPLHANGDAAPAQGPREARLVAG